MSQKVIVKPRRGVASDRVKLCHTLEDVATATRQIVNTTEFGTYHKVYDAALMQDYVDGMEYAVDVVSSRGQHKTTALWIYEKTSTDSDGQSNPFAYLCGKLVSSDDPSHPYAAAVMDYVDECLTALNVKWGMSHTEVKVSSDGKIRLMEVNVRQQNDHFAPICSICIGYNALDVCLAAYLVDDDDNNNDKCPSDTNLFYQIPRRPILLRQGMIVNLACFVEGEIANIHHLDDFTSLDSFVAMELFPGFEIGNTVQRTKDIRSDCGWVHLINDDDECLMRDYVSICRRMPTLFEIRK
jgi:ATP-grasp domain